MFIVLRENFYYGDSSTRITYLVDEKRWRFLLGFGFSIVGGIDNDHFPGNFGIFVSKVNDGGSAAESGRLKEGDRIISVIFISFHFSK